MSTAQQEFPSVEQCQHAAEQGAVEAQYNLGLMYATGLGVARDYVLAHKWFSIAAVHGSPEAHVDRTELALDMTSEEIAEAQRLAREWTTTH
jgi:TPR repeat protein